MIKAIIFDMDGLMFDTESLFIKCGIEAGKNIGYNVSKELIIKCIGTNNNKIKEIFLGELGEDFPFENFNKEYEKLKYAIISKEGIKIKFGLYELLNYLINNNYKIAIASSNKKEAISYYLSLANIDKRIFNVIISGDDFEKGKPEPDIYLTSCKLLGIEPREAMVLEDSNNGIKASYLAGCFTVAIPDIVIITDEVLKMVDEKFKNLLEVKNYLENKYNVRK
jgi:HAD superfamily hydrolase (TIGR01509 family)